MSQVPPSGSGGSSTSSGWYQKEKALMAQQQEMFYNNFALQTQQAENDNTNSVTSAVEASHAQAWSSATAAQREVGEANAHISA